MKSCRNALSCRDCGKPGIQFAEPGNGVQVIAYEVRMAWLATQENGERSSMKRRRIRWSMIWSVFMVSGTNAAGNRFYP